jgi:leukotriene-A4 hydrolase
MDTTIQLDFVNKKVKGTNIISMVSQVDFLYDIYLDFNGMTIFRVTDVLDNELAFSTKQENVNIGWSLHIFLTTPLNKGKSIDIVVYYETNDKQTATSWVPAANTLGKHMDYMYTQCESVHCRSLIPMQDTPSMKFTYDIHVITERKYVTYVSGNRSIDDIYANGVRNSYFSMDIPVPGYLIAVVSGALKE